jgi:hypothetical protein
MAEPPILAAMRVVGGAEKPKHEAADAAAAAAYERVKNEQDRARPTDWVPLVKAMCDEYKTFIALDAALVGLKKKWIPDCWLGERDATWLSDNKGKHGLSEKDEENRTRWRKRVNKAAETLRDKCRAELEVRRACACSACFCAASTSTLFLAGARGQGGRGGR